MSDTLTHLLDTNTIRQRCGEILQAAQSGQTNFSVDLKKLDEVADYVINVSQENYPDGNYPYHGRINHLNAGGVKRTEGIPDATDLIDLIFVSVLVDAGAGPDWKFTEGEDVYVRSEGLAVASYALYHSGTITERKVLNAEKLKKLNTQEFETSFQVSATNPLVGVEGRVKLLNQLGETLLDSKRFPNNRAGDLIEIIEKKYGKKLEAKDLLKEVLVLFHDIWPTRQVVEEINLADVWKYQGKLIPFHKLSQWLTYSLVEAFEQSGFEITNLDSMTGLPEYRNGGLFIDMDVINLRNLEDLAVEHTVDSEFVIEWRALSVALLDELAQKIRTKLKKNKDELPLVKILEGGTWSAGRKLANEKRGGKPPLKLKLDGTVF